MVSILEGLIQAIIGKGLIRADNIYSAAVLIYLQVSMSNTRRAI